MKEPIIDSFEAIQEQLKKTRRQLLPLWIKIFLWIFFVMGGLAAVGFLAGLFGANFSLALYGLETYNPVSAVGVLITFLFVVKGITSFALWTEKDWAINIAFFDGIVGIIVCSVLMFVMPFVNVSEGFYFNFRLELPVLILYLYKLNKIKDDWKVARLSA